MSDALRVGRIPFLVCAPFFHHSLAGIAGVEFKDGPPSAQNRRLREGAIDLSPSSSLEYALKPDDYALLPGLCTAGKLEIRSVRLFSQKPWGQLHQEYVQWSSASATSNALVQILSHQRYGVRPRWVDPGAQPGPDALTAMVAIGDEALAMAHRGLWTYSYDLASEWQQWHHLPFAFGLWLVRKQAALDKLNALEAYAAHLHESIANFKHDPEGSLMQWLRAYPSELPIMDILDFYSSADYQFTEAHRDSLRVFYSLAQNEGIIGTVPELRFVF